MNKSVWLWAVVVTIAVLGGIAYLQYGKQPAVQEESAATSAAPSGTSPDTVQSSSATQDSIATLPPDASVPALTDSDKAVQGALETLFRKSTLSNWLIVERIIHRIVATIDSLDGEPVALHLRPLRHVEGLPIIDTAADGGMTLSAENSKRYAPYVDAFKNVDAKRVADFYLRYQPLFQKSYEELGYSGQSFNDRLLKVIDHLLATPEVNTPVKLLRPKVLYEFDDAQLEQRSSGQKIMIRIGRDNAAIVKAKLREIRAALTAAR